MRPFLQLNHRATDADVVTQIQILLGRIPVYIEAVEHTAQFPSWVMPQNSQSIFMSIPDTENHRLFHFPCQIQLIAEPQMLFQAVLFLTLAVIVQTDFTDGNSSR